MSIRAQFLCAVFERMHVPYLWGGKDGNGIDCSGLATESLHRAGGPDWRWTHNTDRLWLECPEPPVVMPGDLALYGGRLLPDGARDAADVSHVMVIVSGLGAGRYVVMGACGGNSTTTTVEAAHLIGASVQPRGSHKYRGDFRGFRRLPLE